MIEKWVNFKRDYLEISFLRENCGYDGSDDCRTICDAGIPCKKIVIRMIRNSPSLVKGKFYKKVPYTDIIIIMINLALKYLFVKVYIIYFYK